VDQVIEALNRMILNIFKKNILPIGIDLGSGYLKMAQIRRDDDGLHLHAASVEETPRGLSAGSAEWQRWVAQTVHDLSAKGNFHGREAIAAMSPEDMFIEQFQIDRVAEKEVDAVVMEKIAKKLPFDPSDAMIKQVLTDNNSNGHFDVLVMAAERQKVDRHLAIYEKAGLNIKGIGVWPVACINSYVNFFGRRKADADMTALLVEIGSSHTNIVICKYSELLFARVISIGMEQIEQDQVADRLMSEIDACVRYFETNSGQCKIQRVVFFSDRNVNRVVCEKIAELARSLQVPAQIGDVLAAIGIENEGHVSIDRRGPKLNWAKAFGLSLEGGQ
jgi:Tfp pilus assembly PilM family ATPase